MKKVIICSLFLLVGSLSFAQEKEKNEYLEIDFVEEYELEVEQVLKRVPAQWRKQAEPAIKQELANGNIKIDAKLVTDGKVSSYEILPKVNNSQSGPTFILQQITAMGKGKFFKFLDESVTKKEQDLWGEKFIVVDTLKKIDWKISREDMEIAGYKCRKATGIMNDSIDVVAYFSPKINFKDGPSYIMGLPGLILRAEFETESGKQIIYAKSVAVKEGEPALGEPRKGEEISTEEFMKKIEALQKKMQEMHGEGVDTE